jgi:rare lipoprotein A
MPNQFRKLLTIAFLTSTLSAGFSSILGEAATAKTFKSTVSSHHNSPEKTLPSRQLVAGRASWYGYRFQGRRTASGERFNAGAYTAAHRRLPFGTRVKVTNIRNGRSVVVRINDRGPYARGRVIDLSKAAAQAIGMVHSGTAPVRLQILGR